MAPLEHLLIKSRLEYISSLIAEQTVLVVGGHGWEASICVHLDAADVLYIDPNPARLRYIQNRFQDERIGLYQAEPTQTGIEAGCVDVVILRGLPEDGFQRRQLLVELKRVLNPEGFIYLVTQGDTQDLPFGPSISREPTPMGSTELRSEMRRFFTHVEVLEQRLFVGSTLGPKLVQNPTNVESTGPCLHVQVAICSELLIVPEDNTLTMMPLSQVLNRKPTHLATQRIQGLQRQLKALNSEFSRLEGGAERLVDKLESSKQRQTALEIELAELELTNTVLNQQVAQLKSQNEELSQAFEASQQKRLTGNTNEASQGIGTSTDVTDQQVSITDAIPEDIQAKFRHESQNATPQNEPEDTLITGQREPSVQPAAFGLSNDSPGEEDTFDSAWNTPVEHEDSTKEPSTTTAESSDEKDETFGSLEDDAPAIPDPLAAFVSSDGEEDSSPAEARDTHGLAYLAHDLDASAGPSQNAESEGSQNTDGDNTANNPPEPSPILEEAAMASSQEIDEVLKAVEEEQDDDELPSEADTDAYDISKPLNDSEAQGASSQKSPPTPEDALSISEEITSEYWSVPTDNEGQAATADKGEESSLPTPSKNAGELDFTSTSTPGKPQEFRQTEKISRDEIRAALFSELTDPEADPWQTPAELEGEFKDDATKDTEAEEVPAQASDSEAGDGISSNRMSISAEPENEGEGLGDAEAELAALKQVLTPPEEGELTDIAQVAQEKALKGPDLRAKGGSPSFDSEADSILAALQGGSELAGGSPIGSWMNRTAPTSEEAPQIQGDDRPQDAELELLDALSPEKLAQLPSVTQDDDDDELL